MGAQKYIFLLFLTLPFYCCTNPGEGISIFAGSITKIFLDEINLRYEGENRTELSVQYGGSGVMLSQFIYGEGDIYISACDEFMRKALEMKMIEPSSVFRLTSLHPAIVVRKGERGIKDFNSLISREFGIANPEEVCIGKLTEEIFKQFGKEEFIKKAKIYSHSVLSLTNALLIGSVDGIIGWEELRSLPGIEVIPIPQVREVYITAGVSRRTKRRNEAMNYLKFLLSDKAKEIMKKHGFQPYEF
jgi:molybdate transport system substrate-binding protein